MATKKNIPVEDKLEKQDFPLFEAIEALDKKDYYFYDRLTEEQQRKFIPFMLIKYLSYVKGSREVSGYYTLSTNYHANKYFFNENVQKHPKLQWLMLCAASPGIGKQYHPWMPQIKESVSKLRDSAKQKDTVDYYKKVYPKASEAEITEIAKVFVQEHKRKMYFASIFPEMKYEDIDILSQITTDETIEKYEKDRGNI